MYFVRQHFLIQALYKVQVYFQFQENLATRKIYYKSGAVLEGCCKEVTATSPGNHKELGKDNRYLVKDTFVAFLMKIENINIFQNYLFHTTSVMCHT